MSLTSLHTESTSTGYHVPVMVDECIEGLNIQQDGVYVDATFGGGGHSRAILKHLGPDGRLYAFDRDAEALENAPNDDRLLLIHENFAHLKRFLRLYGVRQTNGILADLGVSSHQIDCGSRGFSTRIDGPLDLRMDQREGETAADIVNNATQNELERLLHLYGELPNAKAMAQAIVKQRNENPILTTNELCEAVGKLLPRGRENKTLAMLFQALRISVNREMEALQELLEQATDLLCPGGRICVISYHSLEDRLVKNFFRAGNFDGIVDKDFYGKPQVELNAVTRKPIVAGNEEIERNSRSRSAKLRIAEKIQDK